MRTRNLQQLRAAVAAGLIVGIGLLAGNVARADLFTWHPNCTSENWHACCTVGEDNYTNWSPLSWPSCPAPPPGYPGETDDVELLTYSVYLNDGARVWSLNTSGPFQLALAPGGSQLEVYTSATFNSVFYFDAGTLAGLDGWPSSFDFNYGVEFRTSFLKNILGADFNVNGGTAVVLGDGDIVMGGEAVMAIRPLATFQFDTDASIANNPYIGACCVNNEGLFQKSAGTGTSRVDVPLNNTGTVAVHTGILQLNAEDGTSSGAFEIDAGAVLEFAAHTLAPGVTFTGDGLVRVPHSGHVILAAGAAPSIADFEMAATECNVLGSGDLQITETFNWLAGFIETSGTTTLAATCATTLSGSDGKGAVFGTLNNAGTLTWTGEGDLYLADGTLNNLGIFDVLTDRDIMGPGTINNLGTFTKAGSPGETAFGGTFSNTNLVDVRSGRLSISTYTQTAGTTKLNGGDIQSGEPLHLLGGVLTGSGTVYAGVNNDGAVVRPGLSPGTIVVDPGGGTYTQAAGGTLDIEVGGTVPGTQYDQLITTGLAMLDGTINIGLISGFVPAPGDEFEVMTYLVHVGEFAAVNLPTDLTTRRFKLEVGATSVVLRAFLTGDLNCDGAADFGDIDPFVLALTGQAGYEAAFPGCNWSNADTNGDGLVDFADIDPFVALLTG